MAIAVVQSKQGNVSDNATSISATLDSAITEGNLLTVDCFTRSTTLTNPSGFTTDVNVVNSTELDVARIASKVAGASESTTITITQSPSDVGAIFVREISDQASSALDKTASTGRTTGATTISSGTTATLSQADEICLAICGLREDTSAESVDNSYTLDAVTHSATPGGTDAILLSASRIVAATTAQQTDFSWTVSTTAIAAIATYKEAGGAVGQPTQHRTQGVPTGSGSRDRIGRWNRAEEDDDTPHLRYPAEISMDEDPISAAHLMDRTRLSAVPPDFLRRRSDAPAHTDRESAGVLPLPLLRHESDDGPDSDVSRRADDLDAACVLAPASESSSAPRPDDADDLRRGGSR